MFIVCNVCLCPTDSEVKSGVDIGDGSSVEIVVEFYYLPVMLTRTGHARTRTKPTRTRT